VKVDGTSEAVRLRQGSFKASDFGGRPITELDRLSYTVH